MFKKKFQNIWPVNIIIWNVVMNVKGNIMKLIRASKNSKSNLNF